MIEYYVFDGSEWLSDDEKTWVCQFHHAASFTSPSVAKDIGDREAGDRTIYVLGLLPS